MNTVKNTKRIGMYLVTTMYAVQNHFFRESKFPPINP